MQDRFAEFKVKRNLQELPQLSRLGYEGLLPRLSCPTRYLEGRI